MLTLWAIMCLEPNEWVQTACTGSINNLHIMGRNGKIARLPEVIRTELNVRLRDGRTGRVVLEWLNGFGGGAVGVGGGVQGCAGE